jgi:Tripartite tricarboxylate transporter family receptor/MmgE/PrpD C-terminal domain
LIETPPLLVPLAQTGQVRILAAARSNRSPLLPDVPTIGEAGLPGAEVGSWYGFHAPAGTPKPIIDKLHDEIVKALSDKEVRERLAAIGAEVVTDTPDEFRLNISEIERIEVRAYMLAAILAEKKVVSSFGARFSIPFALASILFHGRSGIGSFDDAAVETDARRTGSGTAKIWQSSIG